ncbi:Ribonuclease H-like superfamily [Arabidopsis suecica]|uniref:Ribonuclease H-like superfamily n=1 Tax=Arabidopsis suecica TaxID=45249 RepID=A0A8T2F3X9_ARASU|nr:Ribonuclease H-like superfamily [Arabidopsis suecica]
MASIVVNVHDYGTWVEDGARVQCTFCDKRMNDFNRLKYHLGNLCKDVTPCSQVPLPIREAFFKMVMEQRYPGRKRGRSNKGFTASETAAEAEKLAQMDVAQFFYEHGVDFSAVDSTSFKKMMMIKTVGGEGGGQMIPDSRDLNGWMFQEALKKVQDRVKEIKASWEITGCSILFDAWIGPKGRDLVSFVADCPAGAVYLKSADVSDIKTDVTALTSLVNGIVEEVGVRNVTQIIACSTSGWVGDLGKQLAGQVFWSVSLSYCLKLMLVEIGKMYSFEDIFEKVKLLLDLINNNPSFLYVFRENSHKVDVSSECEFVMPYLTLEHIYWVRRAGLFACPEWKKEQGIAISSFVNDSTFWESLDKIVGSTSSLVHGWLWFSRGSKHVAYAYHFIESIKKNVAWTFKYERQFYEPTWNVIDDVWHNNHNPLHAAGYFLNPMAYYSDDFHTYQHVYTGLAFSLVHLVKEPHLQVKIGTQLDVYRYGRGCFMKASQAGQLNGVSPVNWWTQKASQYPELQNLAVKILSQTSEGASRYKLKRSVAEKLLLTEGMSHCERKHLEELAVVHYNLQLQSFKA